MRILALILARGGSRRLPGKNIRELGGKPLILWSIDIARQFDQIVDILVSTDSREIADVAATAEAMVPWLRPSHLATDTATSFDAAIHALDWYEAEHGSVDGLLLLQPTSPFRSRETVATALESFATDPHRPVVSLSPVHPNPAWCFVWSGERFKPVQGWEQLRRRSQDLEPAYCLNGALYLISPDALRREMNFVPENFQAVLMQEGVESLDIDSDSDWCLAQYYIQRESGTVPV